MNSMGMKEKALLAMVAVIALYAVAVASWFMHFDGAWKKAKKGYEKAKAEFAARERLIGEKQQWIDAYEEEKAQMPTFEIGKATETTWLAKMDELALKHHILISQRQYGKETEAGDVIELPLEVRSWEGSLDALVHFMHELENTSEGMFDVKAISFKPSSKRGYLKGSFTLTCAYMREK